MLRPWYPNSILRSTSACMTKRCIPENTSSKSSSMSSPNFIQRTASLCHWAIMRILATTWEEKSPKSYKCRPNACPKLRIRAIWTPFSPSSISCSYWTNISTGSRMIQILKGSLIFYRTLLKSCLSELTLKVFSNKTKSLEITIGIEAALPMISEAIISFLWKMRR